MKAVRLVQPHRPLELHEVPIPQPGPDEVLIRVHAAGICHSDVHYRAGKSRIHPLPLTLGHEVAGVIEATGANVKRHHAGDRVCVHYLSTCGTCEWCIRDNEQFCAAGEMIGKHRNGGYAEFIVMPARSVFALPVEIPFEHGAIMMCSSATSYHALRKARFRAGETVAVFGVGGLGISAIQIAQALGAREVFAIDIQPSKLELAKQFGAVPVNARLTDAVTAIRELTQGRGTDVALELVGLPSTMRQAVQALAIMGRAALAGITEKGFEILPYQELINREAEIIGVSDHLACEIPELLAFARSGRLSFNKVVTRTVPLEAAAINDTLDRLEKYGDDVRVVVRP